MPGRYSRTLVAGTEENDLVPRKVEAEKDFSKNEVWLCFLKLKSKYKTLMEIL